MITYIGLGLIIVGWIFQLINKGKDISKVFVLVYSFGALLLVLDGVLSNLYILAILNLVSFIVAIAVYLKNRKK